VISIEYVALTILSDLPNVPVAVIFLDLCAADPVWLE